MMTFLPAGNVKSLPGALLRFLPKLSSDAHAISALNMLLKAHESGEITQASKRIVEYSSGNTAISLAITANILGMPPVGAYISNKNSRQKMDLLRFFVSQFPSSFYPTIPLTYNYRLEGT